MNASIVKVELISSNATSTVINGCAFSLISYSSGNGTCLNGALGSSSSLNISNTSMTSCSGGYGGGIYLSLTSTPSILSVNLSSYSSNTARSYGPTLFVYSTASNHLTTTHFPNFMTCDSAIASEAYGRISSGSTAVLADVLNYTTSYCFTWNCSEGEPTTTGYDGVIYVDPFSTSNASSCGAHDYACANLYDATKTSKFSNSSSGSIILLQTATHSSSNAGLSVSSKVTIQAFCESSNSSTIVEVSSGECMLSANGGEQTLKSFTISVTGQLTSDISLISITSTASLVLNGMTINSNSTYATSNKALIDVSAGKLTLSGTNTFSSIKRESGNGSVFEFTSLNSNKTISNMTFTGCSSENGGAIYAKLSSTSYKLTLSSLTFTSCSGSGYGGGIYIDGGSYVSTSTLAFSSIKFTSCTATTSGNGIYVSGTNLTKYTGYASWRNLVGSSYSSSKEGVYIGGHDSNSKTVDLLHAAFTPSQGSQSTLYISPSSSGVETSTCGWSDLPCQQIGTAYGHRYTSASLVSVTLTDGSHAAESASTSISQTTTIESVTNASVTKSVSSLSDGSATGIFILSTPSITLTINTIAFEIVSLNCPLFYQSSGELHLHSLTDTSL